MTRSVLRQVADLHDLPHEALKQRWRELYGTEPPTYNRAHLVKRLAYRVQELAYGGLSGEARDRLREFLPAGALDGEAAQAARQARRQRKDGIPVAGTRLVREWRGARHEVTVVRGGFEYDGRRYRSLTAVARAITGSHLNGPSFIGLRKPERKRAS